MRLRIRPRSTTVRRAQSGCADRAAATADSTSSASERATSESTSPVAGESFSKVPPRRAGRSSPATKFWMVLVLLAAATLMR
jgi:hypothetical protein